MGWLFFVLRDDGWHFTIVVRFHRASDDICALDASQSPLLLAVFDRLGALKFLFIQWGLPSDVFT